MTEDELDLLASAYLDGEATSEEVAMVEADPELLARVEELRPITGLMATPTPPPPALREQHFTAALAAFDNPAAVASSEPGETESPIFGQAPQQEDTPPRTNVTSIGSRRRTRSIDRSPARPRSMPQWLPAAAALLLIGGGAIWLAGRTGGDDFDTASIDTAAEAGSDAGADDLGDADTARAASAAADESAESVAAESAMELEEDSAEQSDDAAEDEETSDAADAAGDTAGADEGTATRPTTSTVPATSGGFFPRDPVLSFDEVRGPDELSVDDLPDLRTDFTQSRCGPDFEPDPGSEPVGYLPIEIAGEAAELLVVVDADGTESIVFVDAVCEPLMP